MSHYLLEIVIPPESDVVKAVAQVMAPFDENGKDDDGDPVRNGWWDFYVIGGRWSGAKSESSLDPVRVEEFNQLLNAKNVTVSSVRAGKPELSPASQQVMVDRLWREWFPGKGEYCPFFKHGRDQYKKDGYYADDVCRVDDVPKRHTCSRLIVAWPHWKDKERLEAKEMYQTDFWNGVSWLNTDWKGNFHEMMTRHVAKQHERCSPERIAELPDYAEWIAVTVDYHS